MEAALAAAEPQPPWLSTTCAVQYMCHHSQVTFHEAWPWLLTRLPPRPASDAAGSLHLIACHRHIKARCIRGCASSVALVSAMRCTWSLSTAMTDLRGQFPDIFQAHQTVQQFTWQPNVLQVAKFLDAGMKSLQTVDPSEGPNI